MTDSLPSQLETGNTQKSITPISTQEGDNIKKEDLAAIEKLDMNANRLYQNLKEGIESAVMQGPKGDILPDRKARANLINTFMKATGRFKSDNVINILNLFGKVNTDNNNDIY